MHRYDGPAEQTAEVVLTQQTDQVDLDSVERAVRVLSFKVKYYKAIASEHHLQEYKSCSQANDSEDIFFCRREVTDDFLAM